MAEESLNYNSILGRSASQPSCPLQAGQPLITDISMHNIIGQPHNTINLRKVMDEGKTLFAGFSKGDLGEANSSTPRASPPCRAGPIRNASARAVGLGWW